MRESLVEAAHLTVFGTGNQSSLLPPGCGRAVAAKRYDFAGEERATDDSEVNSRNVKVSCK
jgi:hypothetical protein